MTIARCRDAVRTVAFPGDWVRDPCSEGLTALAISLRELIRFGHGIGRSRPSVWPKKTCAESASLN